MSFPPSKIKQLKQAVKDGNFSIGYACDELNKDLELPFYVYLQHWKTGDYVFIEINEEYVLHNFINIQYVTKGHIIKHINEQNYRIILESQQKINVFKELKKRYEKLLHSKKELDIIIQLFDENPEYVI